MHQDDSGFSMMEMLIVVLIIAIIAAIAIPQAFEALKAYRLHNDAAAIAKELNVARFRATSQNTPYRVHIDTTSGTFYIERLCGDLTVNPAKSDASCTTNYSTYTSDTYNDGSENVSAIEGGTQYLTSGDSFLTSNPGSSCPPPSPLASFSSCTGTTDFYFNTRGMPVDTSGNPVSNGGEAIYVENQDGLADAVTVTVGGQIMVYNWDRSQSKWFAR